MTIKVFSITSGSSFVDQTISANGLAKLFEGSTASYVFNLNRTLLRSEDGYSTVENVMPDSFSMIPAICQTADIDVWGGEILGNQFRAITVIIAAGATPTGLYQKTPETTHGWRNTGALTSGFRPSDTVAHEADADLIPPLVSNSVSSSGLHVIRASGAPPYTWGDSDTGIGAFSVTDLDIATA